MFCPICVHWPIYVYGPIHAYGTEQLSMYIKLYTVYTEVAMIAMYA